MQYTQWRLSGILKYSTPHIGMRWARRRPQSATGHISKH
jgi:hypothetical protein